MTKEFAGYVALGLCSLAYSIVVAVGIAKDSQFLFESIAAAVACLGAAALPRAGRLRKGLALAVLFSVGVLLLGGAAQLWLYTRGSASWQQAAFSLLFVGVAVFVVRSLKLRLITRPYDPPGPGPLAPA